jgi:hypothetical protein
MIVKIADLLLTPCVSIKVIKVDCLQERHDEPFKPAVRDYPDSEARNRAGLSGQDRLRSRS